MKWPIILLLVSGHGIAQQNTAAADFTDTLVPLEMQLDSKTTVMHYFLNGELAALRKCEKGELANQVQTTWYFEGEQVYKVVQKQCLTDDTQILDLAMYNEAHRRSDGSVNYDDLPMNCVSVTVDFTQPKMTRIIDGSDVFLPLKEYVTEKDSLYQSYLLLVQDLSPGD